MTDDPDDDYLGSGVRLRYAIAKYGKDNFEKEVLAIFSTPQEMFDYEAGIVNESTLADPFCMNIVLGGEGWTAEQAKRASPFNDPEWRKANKENIARWNAKSLPKALKALHEKRACGEIPHSFQGRKHTQESLAKQRATFAKIGHQKGEANSQYGTCWVYSMKEKHSKKIARSDLKHFLASGWQKGRRMKFD